MSSGNKRSHVLSLRVTQLKAAGLFKVRMTFRYQQALKAYNLQDNRLHFKRSQRGCSIYKGVIKNLV